MAPHQIDTRALADSLPDVTTRDRHDMPRMAECRDIGADDPRAECETLDSRVADTGARVELVARWAGWECAGSCMRWANGAFLIRFETRDGTRGSRAFKPADAERAARLFARMQ